MSKRILLRHYKDFDYAESQYRENTKTIEQIADEIGVTRAALFDHISKNGITRDLGAAIKNRTMEMLTGDIIDANGRLPTKQEDLIEINAAMQAAIVRSHRADIDRFRRLAMGLLQELEGMTTYQDVFEDLGTVLRSEDKYGNDKLNDAYKKVISLPGRTDTLKKLGDTLKTLIMLERQAFGMKDDFEDEDTRRAKLADPGKPVTSFDSITTRFMKVLEQGVTDVQPAS
jgi:hypothetical protein